MPQLSLPCPHCHSEKIGFAPRSFVWYRPGVPTTILFLQCEGCGGGVLAYTDAGADKVSIWMNGTSGSPGNIIKTFPEYEEPKSPADTPDNVRNAFLSGVDNLHRPNGANAAAMMFRRAIELAAKKINPNGKGNLKKRFGELSDDYVTPAMKDWAQHIRLDANVVGGALD
jgi:hypothetical protein